LSPLNPMLHRTFGAMALVFIELGRFDEAIAVGKKAQRQNPSYAVSYRCLASAFAHLGRDVEAREAAARALEFHPDFTVSGFVARPTRPASTKRYIEGLRKAGLPE
jgi:adenylate cyclase